MALAFDTLAKDHYSKRKARIVELSRSLASVFVPSHVISTQGIAASVPSSVVGKDGGLRSLNIPSEPELSGAPLLRSLVSIYRGDSVLRGGGSSGTKRKGPDDDERKPLIPGEADRFRVYRPMPESDDVKEMLLALLILRSIELERSAESPPPAKKRKIQNSTGAVASGRSGKAADALICHMQVSKPPARQPAFRLPCPDVSLQRQLQLFCAAFLTTDSTGIPDPDDNPLPSPPRCLVAMTDNCIPCSSSSILLSNLPPQLARDIVRSISVAWIRTVLRTWQRDRMVLLSDGQGEPLDFSDHRGDLAALEGARSPSGSHFQRLVLKSVSPSRLTQCLVQKLKTLGLQAKRPVVGVSALGSGISGGDVRMGGPGGYPPTVPPPPPSGPPRAMEVANRNIQHILRTLDQHSFVSHKLENPEGPQDVLSDPSTHGTAPLFRSWKALLARETACDLITRTFVVREPSDPDFATLRYCSTTNCQRRAQCKFLHYKRMPQAHTDVNLGDCSYLDTCRHIFTCKFVHYALDLTPAERDVALRLKHRTVFMNQYDVLERSAESLQLIDEAPPDGTIADGKESWLERGVFNLVGRASPTPPQWIRCDLRSINLSIFRGSVSVVMADPPWDIRMDLPYGTMTDNEMKHLRVDLIQDEGLLFLWVTGRAMEIARECMSVWGYQRVDEIVWVKTNHLHRIIRTGRTGHWLNHSKEHCLVGIKGNPKIFKGIDCDVIVSEVRETSRKPDEIYRMVERLCPQGLKLELFGRQHNLRQNWITLGNQLDGVQLYTPQIVRKFREHKHGMRQVKLEEARRLELAAAAAAGQSIT